MDFPVGQGFQHFDFDQAQSGYSAGGVTDADPGAVQTAGSNTLQPLAQPHIRSLSSGATFVRRDRTMMRPRRGKVEVPASAGDPCRLVPNQNFIHSS